MNSLQTIAYHEAGHCVVAILCGLQVRHVTIRPGQRKNTRGYFTLGHVALRQSRSVQSPEQVQARIIGWLLTCYAGLICQRILAGESSENLSSAEDDYQTALAIQSKCLAEPHRTEANIKQFSKIACLSTIQFLASPGVWQDVVSVANALIERTTLTGGQAKRLIRSDPFRLLSLVPGISPVVNVFKLDASALLPLTFQTLEISGL